MKKIGLASNIFNEVDNIESIWNCFKDFVEQWLVVDSGSTDGTQEKLKEVVGDKLIFIEDDMIQTKGYGYSRTKLIEFSFNMDWVLIIDGDEEIDKNSLHLLLNKINENNDTELIWIPRVHCYGDNYHFMDDNIIYTDWRRVVMMSPDWQPRLIKRIIDKKGKSKIYFTRKVHEWAQGVESDIKTLVNIPVIEHYGYMKSDEKKKMTSELCDKLWLMDEDNKETIIDNDGIKKPIFDTYKKENEVGSASASNIWNKVEEKKDE